MEVITVKEKKITLKKDYLTNGEVNYIVGEVLKIYDQSGDIDGYDYSPLAMITNFYALLFAECIEGYDLDDVDMYNEYYNIGTQYELLRVVTNADEAYYLMMSLSKQINSIENTVNRSLQKIVGMISDKIPDAKTMTKMVNKLPKEWQKAVDDYNQITGKEEIKEDE